MYGQPALMSKGIDGPDQINKMRVNDAISTGVNIAS